MVHQRVDEDPDAASSQGISIGMMNSSASIRLAASSARDQNMYSR